MSTLDDPCTVREPRRMPAWIPFAIIAAALWVLTLLIAIEVGVGDVPREVFGVCLGASTVQSIIAAMVGIGAGLARNQAALSTRLEQMAAEQREMAIGLGENTGAFQQLSARLAQITDPERVDWPSYTAGAADALGVDRAKVLDFPTGGRSRG